MSEQNFRQSKRLLRALLAGRISHFTGKIYPNLVIYFTPNHIEVTGQLTGQLEDRRADPFSFQASFQASWGDNIAKKAGRNGQPVQTISVTIMEELFASGKAKCKISLKSDLWKLTYSLSFSLKQLKWAFKKVVKRDRSQLMASNSVFFTPAASWIVFLMACQRQCKR